MAAESREAILDAFGTETARIESLIDDLIEIHPQERVFIVDRSKKQARDVVDMARQRARESSRNLSHDLRTDTSDYISSTAVPSSTLMGDEGPSLYWQSISPQTSHENPFDPDPLNLVAPGLVDGMDADTEQDSIFFEIPNVLTHSNDHVQVDRSGCRASSGLMATNSVGTVVPAALYLESRDEFGHSNAEPPAQHSEVSGSLHSTAPMHLERGGKTPNSTEAIRQGRPTLRPSRIVGGEHSLTEPQDSLFFQDQPVMSFTSSHIDSRDAFNPKRRKREHGLTQDLENLYLGTGSSDSLCQLKDILAITRGSNSWTLSQRSSTIPETLHVLDTLDYFQQAALFFRRAYLLKLLKLREGLEENAARQNPGESQPMLAVGKVESNVLDCLVAEAYPRIAQRPQEAGAVHNWRNLYEVERTSLKNRFQAAKNWKSLSERFSPGILALVPSGGNFHIQNQKFETLPANALEVLLDLLENKEGGYLRRAANLLTPYVEFILEGTDHPPPLRFESVEKETLINLDSSTLVNLCQDEPPSTP